MGMVTNGKWAAVAAMAIGFTLGVGVRPTSAGSQQAKSPSPEVIAQAAAARANPEIVKAMKATEWLDKFLKTIDAKKATRAQLQSKILSAQMGVGTIGLHLATAQSAVALDFAIAREEYKKLNGKE